MMDKKDGGPAFSGGAYYQHPADGYMRPVAPTHPGMSLRDYFAGQALAGLCGNSGGPFQANSQSGWGIVNCGPCDVAQMAYQLADAMLAEREGG